MLEEPVPPGAGLRYGQVWTGVLCLAVPPADLCGGAGPRLGQTGFDSVVKAVPASGQGVCGVGSSGSAPRGQPGPVSSLPLDRTCPGVQCSGSLWSPSACTCCRALCTLGCGPPFLLPQCGGDIPAPARCPLCARHCHSAFQMGRAGPTRVCRWWRQGTRLSSPQQEAWSAGPTQPRGAFDTLTPQLPCSLAPPRLPCLPRPPCWVSVCPSSQLPLMVLGLGTATDAAAA